MTDTAENPGISQNQLTSKQSLGVGTIISESLSIFFKRFIAVFLISLVPSAVSFLALSQVIGIHAMIGLAPPEFAETDLVLKYTLAMMGSFVAYYVTIALLIQLAYDAKLQRPIRLGRYFLPTLTAILPVIVLGLVITFLFMLGLVLFIIPGLWIYAVFSVAIPAIVIERVGFRGLGRSARLTKNYRWPIVGLMLLILLSSLGISFVAQFAANIASQTAGLSAAFALFLTITSIGTGLTSLPYALLYARLREIKDGIGVDQIASVFD
ncbi:MAG: hypothetical protein AAGA50_02360 [Pseudomonadota bacterium]